MKTIQIEEGRFVQLFFQKWILSRQQASSRGMMESTNVGVDTPIPYRTSDLTGILEEYIGKLELRGELAPYKRLKARLETISRDPRYAFMFGSLTVQDTMDQVLSRLFRRLFLKALQQAFDKRQLNFFGDLAPLQDPAAFSRHLAALQNAEWVVYAKPPFGGPQQALDYLGRYTHRVAITNQRLLSMDGGHVRLRWKDYRHRNKLKTMTRAAGEFIRDIGDLRAGFDYFCAQNVSWLDDYALFMAIKDANNGNAWNTWDESPPYTRYIRTRSSAGVTRRRDSATFVLSAHLPPSVGVIAEVHQ